LVYFIKYTNYSQEINVFKFLFLLMFSGCMTNKKMLAQAKASIDGSNCLAKLEEKLRDNHCGRLEVVRKEHEILVRCKKPDNQRKNFWDTWWFRISSSMLDIDAEELLLIEEHTICIDARFRIEAYPE